jgi:ribosome recycling factor
VLEDESISVRAIQPPALSEERRQQLAEELRKYFAEVDARRQSGSETEAEEILTEAMRSVRPGYRPHQ